MLIPLFLSWGRRSGSHLKIKGVKRKVVKRREIFFKKWRCNASAILEVSIVLSIEGVYVRAEMA